MNENYTKCKMNQKNSKKFVGILRRLAYSESLITNKIKITVSKDEIIEEKNRILIAPSIFKSYSDHEQNSTEKSINTIKNSNKEKINSNPHIESVNYPDSSDFSDDE